jgi:putative transposase
MKFPLVRELADEGLPVVLTCGVLAVTPQAFYKWRARPMSDRDWDDAHLANAMFDRHAGDPAFGYRSLCDEVRASGRLVGGATLEEKVAINTAIHSGLRRHDSRAPLLLEAI